MSSRAKDLLRCPATTGMHITESYGCRNAITDAGESIIGCISSSTPHTPRVRLKRSSRQAVMVHASRWN